MLVSGIHQSDTVHVCVYIYTHAHPHTHTFIFFSIVVYYRILNIVPCNIQDCVVYFIYSGLYLLIYPSPLVTISLFSV